MMTTASSPSRSSRGRLPAGSVRASAPATCSRTSARSARAFFTAPVASSEGKAIRACAASAPSGSPPTSQRPSLVIPMGTMAWPRRSSAAMTDAAEARETSCSPDRPPKITPTRKAAMTDSSSAFARERQTTCFAVGAGGIGPSARQRMRGQPLLGPRVASGPQTIEEMGEGEAALESLLATHAQEQGGRELVGLRLVFSLERTLGDLRAGHRHRVRRRLQIARRLLLRPVGAGFPALLLSLADGRLGEVSEMDVAELVRKHGLKVWLG